MYSEQPREREIKFIKDVLRIGAGAEKILSKVLYVVIILKREIACA